LRCSSYAAGATVIATSSSDDKLVRLKTLGADVGINYRRITDWGQAAGDATGGRGANIVVDTGGATLSQSLAVAASGDRWNRRLRGRHRSDQRVGMLVRCSA
jgi:NADPH:quinone reductase-like Zn-dependent oxidoreductase